jgi:hypothetical protein
MSLRDDLINCIDIPDKVKRQVAIAGIITKALAPVRITPIVVGGAAVQFYTFGQYATMDIDFVGIINDEMKNILSGLGFIREGRYWWIPDTDIMVEFPSDKLAGNLDKVQPVEYDGNEAYFIGIEDLILNRVQEAEHWKDLSSAEWAKNLMVIYYNDIDWPYCHENANKSQCLKKFEEIQHQAKKINKQMID